MRQNKIFFSVFLYFMCWKDFLLQNTTGSLGTFEGLHYEIYKRFPFEVLLTFVHIQKSNKPLKLTNPRDAWLNAEQQLPTM